MGVPGKEGRVRNTRFGCEKKERNDMKTTQMIAALSIAALGATAMGDVFTDEGTFMGELVDSYTNDFTGVPVGVSGDLMFSSGGFSYTVGATGGGSNQLFNDPGLISTDSALDSILVTFTSGNVQAVGGNFWATDINFVPTGTDITITLGDGTVETYSSTGPSDFRGFTSAAGIASIEIDAVDGVDGTPYWAAMDNLTVGTVPAPGAMALLGLGGLAATRRRRA